MIAVAYRNGCNIHTIDALRRPPLLRMEREKNAASGEPSFISGRHVITECRILLVLTRFKGGRSAFTVARLESPTSGKFFSALRFVGSRGAAGPGSPEEGAGGAAANAKIGPVVPSGDRQNAGSRSQNGLPEPVCVNASVAPCASNLAAAEIAADRCGTVSRR